MKQRWAGRFAFAILIALILALYTGALQALVEFWQLSLVYDHGALLSIIVLIIAATELKDCRPLAVKVSMVAGLGSLVSSSLMVTATLADVMLGQMIFLPVVVLFAVAAVYGADVARRLFLPFAMLALSWPVWDFLIGPLQSLTVGVTNWLLDMAGRAAFIEGDTVNLRAGSFVVERGCAGLNFFLVGTILGGMYAHWFLRGAIARVLGIACAIMLSIIANWLRVFLIILAGDMTSMQHDLVKNHSTFGWLLFGGLLLPLFLFGHHLQRFSGTGSEATEIKGVDSYNNWKFDSRHLRRAGVIFLLLAVPSLSAVALTSGTAADYRTCASLPRMVGDWRASGHMPDEDLAPSFRRSDSVASAVYSGPGNDISVWMHSYSIGKGEPEMAGYPNSWFDSREWRQQRYEQAGQADTGTFFGPKMIRVERADATRLIAAGYVIRNRLTGNTLEAKVRRVAAILFGPPWGGALALSQECELNCAEAERSLRVFLGNFHSMAYCGAWSGETPLSSTSSGL